MLKREEAEVLAAKTLEAIDALAEHYGEHWRYETDRRRVRSDLEGLRVCFSPYGTLFGQHGKHAERYSAGLILTAEGYGVTL